MRLLSRVVLLLSFSAALDAADAWPQIFSSIGVIGSEPGISVAGPGSATDNSWKRKLEEGAFLILEGGSPLSESFGFRSTPRIVGVTSMVDIHLPKLPIILEKPLSVHNFTVPPDAQVFTRDRWSSAPMVAGLKVGKGGILWVVDGPGPQGFERFPYLPQALSSLGYVPPVRANRTWAFFDYSYRTRVDLDYFAARWRKAGIGALHVASWHFYETDPERDAYLRRLIEACHREGILVYAWLELPHVSRKFWDEHPLWREKTAVLQDAALDWRKLMNLENPDCARAVKQGVAELIRRFNWDGVNLAELYFESLEGAGNPSRFTPMNDDIRSRFRADNGFDPVELWSTHRDARSLRLFLDFRIALARRMQADWLGEMEKARTIHPDLDIVLTHVDDRMDRGMTDAIGTDSERAFSLLRDHAFTFLVEDPATLWNLGPKRYPEIAKRYPASPKLAIDINVVDRYQDVYPTKQQTGIELFELVHMAAQSFPRVALYFENSILAPDLPFLSTASSVVTRFERNGPGVDVDSPHGFTLRWSGPAQLDGIPWAALDADGIIVPAGKHSIRPLESAPSHRILNFNGDLRSAISRGNRISIGYSSSSRALATLDGEVEELTVDGNPCGIQQLGKTLLLPAGSHEAVAVLR